MCRNFDLRFLLFYYLLSKFFSFFFFRPFFIFFLSILLSFLLLSNWFLFLSFFVFPLLFQHCFIPVFLAHVVSSLAYPNLLETKRLGCCCCCIYLLFSFYVEYQRRIGLFYMHFLPCVKSVCTFTDVCIVTIKLCCTKDHFP
jgi:hypothetical protein